MASFCTSCGNALTGAFCTNCGASQAPAAVAAPKNPKNSRIVKLLLPIGLGVVLLASLATGVTQSLMAAKHDSLATSSAELATSSYDSADSFDSLAADARIQKEGCYYDPYCSADSYSNWINIVDTDDALAASSRETGDAALATAKREVKAKSASQVISIIGFVVAGLSAAGLGLVFVLRARKKKVASVVVGDADAVTPAE